MKIIIEVEKIEPGTTFEKTINEIKYDINDIKYNHLQISAFATTNLSDITLYD